jgi:hypothetical protein
MPITGTPAQRKKQVFDEFKAGTLHSGRGGKNKPALLVKKRRQAVAIALSEAGQGRGKQRGSATANTRTR